MDDVWPNEAAEAYLGVKNPDVPHSSLPGLTWLDPAIYRFRKSFLRRRWTIRNRVYPISAE